MRRDDEMTFERNKVVDALYGILADPVRYDALVRELDAGYRVVLSNDDGDPQDNPTSALDRHFGAVEPDFQGVAKLFERFSYAGMGEKEPSDTAATAFPSMDLTEDGTILQANAAASRLLGVQAGDKTAALELDRGAALLLRRTLRRIASGEGDRSFTFLQAYTNDHADRLMLMLSPTGMLGLGQPVAVLKAVDLGWRPDIGAAIGATFDLTRAELDILQGVVSGSSLSDIASGKERSLATVRTQAKSLLRKTEAKSQIELVRLFAAMSLAAPHAVGGDEADGAKDRRSFMLTREDGRTLQVDVFGPEDGAPVLFVHGFVTGTAMTDAMVEMLHARKLRFIAPWRPAFAGSSPLGEAGEAYFEAVTDDIRLVMDRLGVASATLASRDSGVIYAAAAAKRLGHRAKGVIAIAGTVPTRSHRHLEHIALWQRMFAYSARYFPAALPVLARGAMEMVSAGRLDKLLEGLYASPPIDAFWSHKPEVSRLLKESFEATFVQGTKGYEMDARQTATDWTARSLEGLDVPVHYIHGRQDPVSLLRHVEELAVIHPRISVEVIEDGGQLIWYSHPQQVIEAIGRRLSKAGPNGGR
jgi:pimeloyl-ACP methyl ester carboxylesterase/DNA-binding CsgD family transcriptional regulator